MLRTGSEHLDRLRDGRTVYIGSERLDDVTTHPAFRNAVRTVAAIYDMKADPVARSCRSPKAATATACITCRPAPRRICASACVLIA